MKYDDLIETARAQDPGKDAGPSFDDLMAASAVTATVATTVTSSSTKTSFWLWLAGGVTLAGGIGLAVATGGDAPGPEPRERARAPIAAAETAAAGAEAPTPAPEVAPPEQEEERAVDAIADDEAPAESGPAPRPRAETTNPEDLYREVEAHLARGERAVARTKLGRLVRRHRGWSGHATAMLELGHLDEQLGRGQSAYCVYQRYLDAHPRDGMARQAREAMARLESSGSVSAKRCR